MKRFFLLVWFILPYCSLKAEEGGYTDKLSYTQGDTVYICISSKRPFYNLSIFNIVDSVNSVIDFPNIPGAERVTPDSSYMYGCNWPVTRKFSTANFVTGVYKAQFMTSRGLFKVVFFVKPVSPGSHSDILVVPSTNTWQAYNPFGGKSLYNYNSTNNERAYKVSFQRPTSQIIGFPEFINSEELIIKWLYENNFQVEFAADYDLHKNPNLLSNYKIVIIAGHSEYWSYQQRHQIQRFLDQGGKLIILSGNTCWWQVRFEDGVNTMVCYKDIALDPLYGVADSIVTYHWSLPPVNNPENKLTGVSFLYGGYVNNNDRLPASLGYGDYAAINSWHWVYEGTDIQEGDEYGYDEGIVGNEVDGALFNWQNGIPVVTGGDGTPKNYLVLGISPAASDYTFTEAPHGMMGLYFKQSGGAVFNPATIFWGRGLKKNHVVEKITKNVLKKFISNTFPPSINSWSPFNVSFRVINHENIPLNNRNFYSAAPKSYNLKVSASDKPGNTIHFAWEMNGNIISTDSIFDFHYGGSGVKEKVTHVKCNVYNNTDTAAIIWNFFNTQLAFYSPPAIKPGLIKVKLPVYNGSNSPLQFSYTGPSGLNIDPNGVLLGTLSVNQYNITLVVQAGQNLSDTLVYTNSSTGINEQSSVPEQFMLYQNYPNPFNPSTTIKYSLVERGDVSLIIYDILGREVLTLVKGFHNAGSYTVNFNGSALPSGTYFCKLYAGVLSDTRKLVLIK